MHTLRVLCDCCVERLPGSQPRGSLEDDRGRTVTEMPAARIELGCELRVGTEHPDTRGGARHPFSFCSHSQG